MVDSESAVDGVSLVLRLPLSCGGEVCSEEGMFMPRPEG